MKRVREKDTGGLDIPKRRRRGLNYHIGRLSTSAAAQEQQAKQQAEKEAPELCDAFGTLISCIPRQGQLFGGQYEWKPWCRFVVELEIIATDPDMQHVLSELQGSNSTLSQKDTDKNRIITNFFYLFPFISYILAFGSPVTRAAMVKLDHVAILSSSAALSKSHPARIVIQRRELYTLLQYSLSQSITEALLALSSVRSFTNIPERTKCRIIVASLSDRCRPWKHKAELVRLIYECGLETLPAYRACSESNLVVHLLDRFRRRLTHNGCVGPWDRRVSGEARSCDFDLVYCPDLVCLVSHEMLYGITSDAPDDILRWIFPLYLITKENYERILHPFLSKHLITLSQQAPVWLMNVVDTLLRTNPPLLTNFINNRLLPLLLNRKDHWFFYIIRNFSISSIMCFVEFLKDNKDKTHFLNLILKDTTLRYSLAGLVAHVVETGASLDEVDIDPNIDYSADFIIYFLQQRTTPTISVLLKANCKLKSKEYIDYVTSHALSRADKVRLAKSAFSYLRMRIVRAIEDDIGPLFAEDEPWPDLNLACIKPRRFLKLAAYAGDKLYKLWSNPRSYMNLHYFLVRSLKDPKLHPLCLRILQTHPLRHVRISYGAS